jgi:hypothetical protein
MSMLLTCDGATLMTCSAASMLETLYFYALAHQNDFDVCWPRGSIAETIFTPMVNRIKAAGGQVRRYCCTSAQTAQRSAQLDKLR